MNSNIKIRRYQTGDEVKITKFLDMIFPNWSNSSNSIHKIDFWRWKYLNNPLKKYTILVVENDDDDIIACTHGFYRDIKIDGMNCKLQVDSDMAIHPDYRGTGLYNKLVREKERALKLDGSDISIWVTTNPKVIHQGKKYGYDSFPLNQMIKIKDTKMLPIHKRIGYKAIESLYIRGNNGKVKLENIMIKEISEFGEEATDFWKKMSEQYTFMTKRDKETLNWRYCDGNCGDYRSYVALSADTMMGYIVSKVVEHRDGTKTGIIVDMLTEREGAGVAIELINSATDDLLTIVNVVKYLVIKGHPFQNIFKKCGFISRPSGVHIGYRVDNQGIADIVRNLQNVPREFIHIQYGDTDFV